MRSLYLTLDNTQIERHQISNQEEGFWYLLLLQLTITSLDSRLDYKKKHYIVYIFLIFSKEGTTFFLNLLKYLIVN